MRDLMNDVRAFHDVISAPSADEPTIPSYERLRLRLDLIHEEVVTELMFELSQMKNKRYAGYGLANDGQLARYIKVADAIADSIVVLLGTAVEMGIPMDRVWDEVHRSNMAKAGGGLREDGKALKPPGWEPPDIHKAIWGDNERRDGAEGEKP